MLDKLHIENIEVSKSKAKEWLCIERNRLKESYLDIYQAPGEMVQFDWGTKRI
ncbi:hypothetical protein [Psychrobacillus psychrotolerans]|uniref:hypothetical protein n=1 Tax=Psychrobacillus psychrotolerans TaxID=126156 RepID=UPI003B01F1DD